MDVALQPSTFRSVIGPALLAYAEKQEADVLRLANGVDMTPFVGVEGAVSAKAQATFLQQLRFDGQPATTVTIPGNVKVQAVAPKRREANNPNHTHPVIGPGTCACACHLLFLSAHLRLCLSQARIKRCSSLLCMCWTRSCPRMWSET